MQLNTSFKPKEITQDIDTGVQYASFSYHDGIQLAKENKWKQTTSIRDLNHIGYFIVCCGDVMIQVVSVDYPEIPRRVF